MKILFVSSGNTEFGIDPLIKNQGESLIEAGVDLDFFTIKGKGLSGYLKNTSALRTHIRKNKYDLVHAHFVYSGWLSVLVSRKVPIVLSVMGSDAYGKYLLSGKRILSSYFMMGLTQLIQPFTKALIIKSRNIFDYIYLKDKAYLIPNGVNFKRFKPMNIVKCREELVLSKNKKIVLFLADPEKPVKNFSLLKDASAYLDLDQIDILNPYPIDNEKFPLYLNACDVFVLTSYNEGSPNVIKEAMACNTPIVATRVGDIDEVISGTDGCYFVDYKPDDVADNIKQAISFGKRTNGREDIRHLESKEIAKKIIEVYQKVLEK